MTPSVTIPLDEIDAVIFDMDGVVTKTATVHAAAWKRLFDAYLEERAAREGQPFRPFDEDTDYRRYVDGKPRYDGVASFLASRGISLPRGDPSDPPETETVCGLGNRKNRYFVEHLAQQGAEVYQSTVDLIHTLRDEGIKVAVFSASKNCEDVLKAAGVLGLFAAKVDGVDADELGLAGKPDPAMLLEAARRLAVAPERAVIIEDAIAGVQAGRAGGFYFVIGVNRSDQAGVLREQGADVEVNDLAEVTVARGAGTGTSSDDLPSALDRFEEVRQRMAGKPLVVFLDYDGTLTPIVERPEEAVLSDEMRDTVRGLAKRCPLAIVSGRDLEDVRRHARIEAAYYAGSHGFDLAGPKDWRTEYEGSSRFLSALDQAEAELREPLAAVPGARLERKRFAIAVHYRQAAEEDVGAIEEMVNRVAARQSDLRKTGGKKVFELRPNIDWHKGKAVLWLLEVLGYDGRDVLPIYIGDDETDEDAFRALSDGGIGILVRDAPRPTAAQFALEDPAQVGWFLKTLTEELGQD